jgi:hypothetical protein
VTTNVTRDSDGATQPKSTGSSKQGVETISIRAIPESADVYVDNQYYGSCPAILKLKPGRHAITVKMSGYKDWSREISTEVGSEAQLTASLENGD